MKNFCHSFTYHCKPNQNGWLWWMVTPGFFDSHHDCCGCKPQTL